eukprot:9859180-Prorocentrum_lima.AAC.1
MLHAAEAKNCAVALEPYGISKELVKEMQRAEALYFVATQVTTRKCALGYIPYPTCLGCAPPNWL